MSNEIVPVSKTEITEKSPFWDDMEAFERVMRVAKLFASSDMVPQQYRGNISNTVIALELAHRCGASPLAVMQNIYIVHGKPSWAGQFVLALIKGCGRYENVYYEYGNGSCRLVATSRANGVEIKGPEVTLEMAKAEGWLHDNKDKNGKFSSKWKTIPDLMLRYRAAAFFGRTECPDVLVGMSTQEETEDIKPVNNMQDVNKPMHATTAASIIGAATAQSQNQAEPMSVAEMRQQVDKLSTVDEIIEWRGKNVNAIMAMDEEDQNKVLSYCTDAVDALNGG